MLSGGQKQRVAIAGVLAMQTRAMVMDEPTAMLDPEGRREVLDTVERLRSDKGLTLVLITHFMDEALRADRVLVMEDGQVTMQGTPREVLADEARLREAGLEPPFAMSVANRLRARGLALPGGIMTGEELVSGLCSLKR
jgi:energy-coupling factor transport system ATP-binding protein